MRWPISTLTSRMLSHDGHRKTIFDAGSLPHFGQRNALTIPITYRYEFNDFDPAFHYSSTPLFQSPFLRRSPFDFFERFLKLSFQIPNVKANSPRAVQGGNADHDQIQYLLRQRLIRMVV